VSHHRPEDSRRTTPAGEGQGHQLIMQAIGGWRGLVDSGLPVIVFVVANAIGGLRVAIWSAIGAGVLLFVVRLARREPVQQAIGGLLAVAIAAFIAARTGQARGYFLFGIWRNLIYGAVFLGSVLVRWPLLGLAWEYLEGRGQAWRHNRTLMRTYTATTLLWAAVFFSRTLVQHFFYQRNATGWLAATSLAMGYPLFAVVGVISVWAIRRARRKVAPPTDKAAEPAETSESAEPAGRIAED
jgi:hypothetical protein